MKKNLKFIILLCLTLFIVKVNAQTTAQQNDLGTSKEIQNSIDKLKSDDEIIRFEAEKSLVKIGKNSLPPLNKTINKETGYTKVSAAKVVLSIEPDKQTVLQTLAEVIGDKQEKLEVRRYAAYVLALSPSGVPLLVKMMIDDDVFARRSAAFALNELFDISGALSPKYTPVLTNAIPTMVAALGDEDETVSGLATETLLTLRGDIDFLFDVTTASPNQKLKQIAQQVKEARHKGNSTFGQQIKMTMKSGAEDQMKGNKNFLTGRLGVIYVLSIGGEPVQDYRSIPQAEKLSLRVTINPQTRRACSGLSRFNPYQDLK